MRARQTATVKAGQRRRNEAGRTRGLNRSRRFSLGLVVAWLLLAAVSTFAAGTGLKVLPGHLPKLPPGLVPQGPLARTNQLRLALGLPLRDPKGLDEFLAQVYEPASPNFRLYLTPEEFTSRFGPSEADYQAVLDFARTNGLAVTAMHGNRLLLDVQGTVADIQRAFHLTLLSYRHPTEARQFFAPDTEPSVNAALPLCDVSGLNNYVLPRPKSRKVEPATAVAGALPRTGSGSYGAYLGHDFRAAYLPGVTLTGTGQMVGLLQFDGFYANDITAYETAAGLPNVPLQTVLLDGYNGVPTTGANSGNDEVSLDIEMAMAMAPGLSRIVVFEAGPSGFANDILNRMAASNQIKQLSSSWGWSGGPSTTTENIFKQMAAQGQSFFNASGDSDAFTAGANSVNGVDNPSLNNAPSSSPNITVVGGTTLTTSGAGGSWSSETVWNWGLQGGSYVGSSGGISSYYSIPSWQTGISMTSNGGSTTQRNIPDVALTADNVYVTYGNGTNGILGGTSCAAPLWAGFTALVNQQAATAGRPSVGFLNPAFYAIGKGSGFSSSFHDITTGNNTNSDSAGLFYARPGYDLCTGWGTPAGQALINALAGAANSLAILAPASGFTSAGPFGGPFNPASQTLVLTNSGTSSLAWSIANTSAWLALSSTNGTLAAGASAQVSASWTAAAGNLTNGTYGVSLLVSNYNGGSFTYAATLKVGQSLVQNGDFETGTFTGWTLVGNTTDSGSVYNAVEDSASFDVAHSGTYGAFLGDTNLASLSQTIPTVPGQFYLLSLWLNSPTNGPGLQFIVNWNTNSGANNPVYSLVNPAKTLSWTNLQFVLPATGTNTTLQFQAENLPDYFGLDDVSVTPVPLPLFQNAASVGNGVQLSWLASPGLAYQVQYKSDLRSDWVNLAPSFVAVSNSLTQVDTNALTASPQRFYRLVVSPVPY